MKFRSATLNDLREIVDIYNSTVSSCMVTADTKPVSVESKLNWFHEHNEGKRPLWVVENEKGIIGWVSFSSFYGRPAYDNTAEVSIYLLTTERGKGIGKEVLKHVIDQCEKLGIKTLLGYIFAHNEPSLKLFRSFGFSEWAKLPNIAVLDGVERSLVIVGKRVLE
jgi:L-amino acid N-acyltransferase YncA